MELLNNFDKVSNVKLDTLLQQFFTFKIEKDEDVMKSLARLRTLWVDLQREQEASGEGKLPQNQLIPRILSILPDDEYREFKSQWDSIPKDEKSSERLMEQIKMRLQRQSVCVKEDATTAFVTSGARHGANGEKKWRKGTRSQKARKSQPSTTTGMSKLTKANDGVKSFRGYCFRCNKPGHMGKFCPDFPDKPKMSGNKTETFLTHYIAFICQNDSSRNVWLKDDGATAHITNSAEYFRTYRHFDKPVEIVVGNKQTIPAYGCGEIDMCATVGTLQKSIELSDILYAPDISKNLLSASKAIKRGISNFGDSDDMICRFFRKENPKNVLLEDPCSSSGLFELRAKPVKPEGGSAALAYLVDDDVTTPFPDTTMMTTTKLPKSWFGRKSKIDKFQIFGSTAFVHVPDVNRSKLDDKALKGYLVGYCDYDGYRVFIPSKNDTIKSANVVFNEQQIGPTSLSSETTSSAST
nr:uncharacterized protein LOC107449289 [Parasteatoda tepidariorum]